MLWMCLKSDAGYLYNYQTKEFYNLTYAREQPEGSARFGGLLPFIYLPRICGPETTFFYMNLVFVLLVKSFERYWWFGSIPCRLFCYQVWCAYDVSICFLHHDNVSFIYTERDTDTYVEVYRFVLLPSSRDLNQTEKTWGKELMSLYKVKSGNLDWEVIGGLQPFFAY